MPDNVTSDQAVVKPGWRRVDAGSPLVPIALFFLLFIVVAALSTILPGGVRGPAALVAAAVVVLIAYLWLPKPTLLAFALFVLFYDTFARWFGPSMRNFDEAVLPVLIVAGLWRTKPWRERTWFEPVRDGAMLLVVVLAVAASLVNAVPANVWILGLLLMLKGIAFLYLVLWHQFDEGDVRQASIAVLAVGVAILTLAGIELANLTWFRQFFNVSTVADVRGELPGLESLFVLPVLFSWFMGFMAMFLFSYYVVLRRWWMLVGALLFGAAVFLSGRRRAIVGLAVALAGGLASQVRRGVSRATLVKVWLPVGVAALVLAIVFAPGIKTLWDRTVNEWFEAPPAPAPQQGDQIDYINGNPRLYLYQTSVDLALRDFPLGTGLGRFASPMSRNPYSPIYAEYGLNRIWGLTPLYDAYINDTFWPHILGEIGVFGLGAYIVFLGALGVSLWRATRRVTVPIVQAFCLGAWMVYLNALAESLASSMYESPPRIYLAFGAIGIALVLARNEQRLFN